MAGEEAKTGEFTVYKHTSPSGKAYIGITSKNPKQRWGRGYGYRGQPKFWRAIDKYGWDNFDHEVLFSGLTEQEACEKEIELIAEYDSVANGYNSSTGGDYGASRAYKYRNGDVIGRFEVIGRTERKIVIRCLDCGREFERYAGSLKDARIKCKCKLKYNPNPKKMNHPTINGRAQTGREWAIELGISEGAVWSRIKRGIPLDAPLLKPPLTERQCKLCGKTFMPKGKGNIYCSGTCQRKSRAIVRPLLVCKGCGKEFRATRVIDGVDYKGWYCSLECSREHHRVKEKGSKN